MEEEIYIGWYFGWINFSMDKDAQEVVAIKVVRSADSYREAAMIEIDVLRILANKDRMGSRGCVEMKRWFRRLVGVVSTVSKKGCLVLKLNMYMEGVWHLLLQPHGMKVKKMGESTFGRCSRGLVYQVWWEPLLKNLIF